MKAEKIDLLSELQIDALTELVNIGVSPGTAFYKPAWRDGQGAGYAFVDFRRFGTSG